MDYPYKLTPFNENEDTLNLELGVLYFQAGIDGEETILVDATPKQRDIILGMKWEILSTQSYVSGYFLNENKKSEKYFRRYLLELTHKSVD